jgi:hypothetical protein
MTPEEAAQAIVLLSELEEKLADIVALSLSAGNYQDPSFVEQGSSKLAERVTSVEEVMKQLGQTLTTSGGDPSPIELKNKQAEIEMYCTTLRSVRGMGW